MSESTPPLLGRLVDAIVDACHPRQVILFGSRARGDARADSDVDLLVIQDEPFDTETARLRQTTRLYRALGADRSSADLLLYSASEVDYWRSSANHVVGRALREGKVLYERA